MRVIKRKRDLYRLAESEGLNAVNIIETQNNHYRIEGQHRGRLVKIITGYSPSDHRAAMNLRSYIRRAMRAVDSEVG